MRHRIRQGAFALFLSLTLTLLPATAGAMPGGGGGGGGAPSSAKKRQSTEEKAAKRYESGIRSRDRALSFEEKARAGKGGGLFGGSPAKKAEKAWRKSIEALGDAIELAPSAFGKAWADLCLAHRHLGELSEALTAAEEALKASHRNHAAVACRGETQLELGQLSGAKASWRRLNSREPQLAAVLMKSMQAWLAKNEGETTSIADEPIDEFRAWIQERGHVAQR